MTASRIWTLMGKDFRVFLRRKSILWSVLMVPLLIATGLPMVVLLVITRAENIPAETLTNLLDAFSFFFVMIASVLPTAIAGYSLVGEKIEKSLEPLLATPTADGEILFAKSIVAFVPSIVSLWVGMVLYAVLMNVITYPTLGYLYFPNWSFALVMFVVSPLVSAYCIEMSVIISARVNDVRTAQQLSSMLALPFAGIFVASELSALALSVGHVLIISGVLFLAVVVLFRMSAARFRREEILTRWK